MSRPTAAPAHFPYAHRNLADVKGDKQRGCYCDLAMAYGHDATCPIKGPVDYILRRERRERDRRHGGKV